MSKRIRQQKASSKELNIWNIIQIDEIFGEVLDHLANADHLRFKSTCSFFSEGREIWLNSVLVWQIGTFFLQHGVFGMKFVYPIVIEKGPTSSFSLGPKYISNYIIPNSEQGDEEEDLEANVTKKLERIEKLEKFAQEAEEKFFETSFELELLISVCSDLKKIDIKACGFSNKILMLRLIIESKLFPYEIVT
jgi:hypothetical protein